MVSYPADRNSETVVGVSRIAYSDAQHLVNETVEIPEDDGYFAVNLDVFHQLHCLVCLVKSFDSDHSTDFCLLSRI